MWIAVLGSVKLFPNLEAALKGVFNRVLKFFPNASVEDAVKVLSLKASHITRQFDRVGELVRTQAMSRHPRAAVVPWLRESAVSVTTRSRVQAWRRLGGRPRRRGLLVGMMALKRARTAALERAAQARCRAGACYAR